MSVDARNARLDALTAEVGPAGTLTVYSGARPATGGAATTPLVTFTLGSPFAPAASGGTLSPTLPGNATATGTGTASWFRVSTSGGAQVVDGDVVTSGTTGMVLLSTSITSGQPVQIDSWSWTEGNA